MFKHEVEEFANYQVSDKDGKVICLTHTEKEAEYIAKFFAWNDEDYETYYVTGVNNMGDLVIGGGWYYAWRRDREKNVLVHFSLE